MLKTNRLVAIDISKKLILLWILWHLFNPLQVFSNVGKFQSLWLEDGLPSRIVDSINQDNSGYIWIGTRRGLVRYDGIELTHFSKSRESDNSLSDEYIRDIVVSEDNKLWLATQKGGVNLFDPHQESFKSFTHNRNQKNSLSSNNIRTLLLVNDKELWIGTENGLDKLDIDSEKINHFKSGNNRLSLYSNLILALEKDQQNNILIGTSRGLNLYNSDSQTIQRIKLKDDSQPYIRVIKRAKNNSILIGTKNGLYRYRSNHHSFSIKKILNNKNVTSIEVDQSGNIWAGTLTNGLYLIEPDGLTKNYRYDKGFSESLRSNNILELFLDSSGVLWIGTFSSGVNWFDPNTLSFGFYNDSRDSIHCLRSAVIYSVNPDKNGGMWISTQNGLTYFHEAKSICKTYMHEKKNIDSLFSNTVLTSFTDSFGQLWVGTTAGLNRLIVNNEFSVAVKRVSKTIGIRQILEDSNNNLLFATLKGLFLKKSDSNQLDKITIEGFDLASVHIFSMDFDNANQLWLGTKQGFIRLNSDYSSAEMFDFSPGFEEPEQVHAVFNDNQGYIWASVEQLGILKLNQYGEELERFSKANGMPTDFGFMAIIQDDNNQIWISSTQGLIKINPQTKLIQSFQNHHGLQSDVFTIRSAKKTQAGGLVFGGWKGLNYFNPNNIKVNAHPPYSVINDFWYFNQKFRVIDSNKKFSLKKPVNFLQELELTHNDYIFGFEFSALHYSNPKLNKIAYKLDGFDPDWNITSAMNRKINYNNLPAGSYELKFKTSNSNNIWSEAAHKLKISVLPPPWKTWWAYLSYILISIGILISIIRYRTKQAILQAEILQLEVDRQTNQIKSQKQMIESLLEKKNDLFANVSHEFRTPLTLILGPINKLLKLSKSVDEKQQLQMARKNANRLLSLVDQLLIFAKASVIKSEKQRLYNLSARLDFICESFSSLVDEKNIVLESKLIPDVFIKSTPDAIEIIFANLLSNAIKYSPANGKVSVSMEVRGSKVWIEVADTGPGIANSELENIFERFTRLDSTASESGAGIGLAVVKELLEVNQAEISVSSVLTQGTKFIVGWTISSEKESVAGDETNFNQFIDLVKIESDHLQHSIESSVANRGEFKSADTVLIIEDNADMRSFVIQSMSAQYNCLNAKDGEEGIQVAIKEIPDIIVCDLMMPKMDGYQVARNLRADERTSHIPIILLTAKGDKESRLLGWKENIDDYITKPFDEEELLARVANLLTVRNILKRKVGANSLSKDSENQSILPEKEKLFLDKVNKVIAKNFHDNQFGRGQMAKKMAVSERQLQRKLKAIIDYNPSDYLREYRLKKAAQRLKDGYQVAQVTEECGFVSPTHFARCFKAQFGVSPKQYQSLS